MKNYMSVKRFKIILGSASCPKYGENIYARYLVRRDKLVVAALCSLNFYGGQSG